jgi:hypothetical protein
MNKRIFLAHKIKLFLPLGLIALFFICIPTLQAEETTPLPDLQFVRMGNTLVAVDQVPLLTDVDATLPQEARVLEREIIGEAEICILGIHCFIGSAIKI